MGNKKSDFYLMKRQLEKDFQRGAGKSKHKNKEKQWDKDQKADPDAKKTDSAKKATKDKIHSANTFKSYMQTINEYQKWLGKNKHSEETVKEYLRCRQSEGKSAWTISKDLAALNKACRLDLTKESVGLQNRSINDVKRSREGKGRTSTLKANSEQIFLAKALGFRRAGIESFVPGDLYIKDGKVFGATVEKGGRFRYSQCLEQYQQKIIDKYKPCIRDAHMDKQEYADRHNTTDCKPFFSAYDKHIDNHSFRHEYAQALRDETAAKHPNWRRDDVDLFVSRNLGHNRISIVRSNYYK